MYEQRCERMGEKRSTLSMSRKGFTLVELIVVLVLMGILMTVAAPSLHRTWQGVQVDLAAKQLQQNLRWAQQIAARDQEKVTITFFTSKEPNRYVVRKYSQLTYLRDVNLPAKLDRKTLQTITVLPDQSFQKNGHLMLEKGGTVRYVYYYQTGRSRITSKPSFT